MKILIASANYFELAKLISHLEESFKKISFFEYQKRGISVFPLVLGQGMVQTTFGLARYKDIEKIDLLIYSGVAASMDTSIGIGNVYQVYKEQFADNGMKDEKGNFKDLFDIEIHDKDKFPFSNKLIVNDSFKDPLSLQMKIGATLNTFINNDEDVQKVKEKYNPDLITLEGAAIHYVCKMLDLDFLHIRAVSQVLVGQTERDLTIALDNLGKTLIEYLDYYSGASISS